MKKSLTSLSLLIPFYYSYKLFGSGFLSNDDASIASSRFDHGNSVLNASASLAQSTGRFYQFIFYTTSQIPYLVPPQYLQMSMGFWRTFFIIVFYCSTLYFFRYFFSHQIAAMALLLSVITIDLTGWYNALVTYPFWITLGISTTLLSSIYLDKYFVEKKNRNFCWFIILFTVGLLSYEALITSIFIYSFVVFRHIKNHKLSISACLKSNKNIFGSYFFVLAIYIFIYVTFAVASTGNYEGTKVGSLNPLVIGETLLHQSVLHSSIKLFFIPESGIYWLSLNPKQIQSFLSNPFTVFLFALITIWIFLIFFKMKTTISVKSKKSGGDVFTITWLLILFIVPNVPLALSKKYQSVEDDSPYTMSLISFVFLNLLLTLVLKEFLQRKSDSGFLINMKRIVSSFLILMISISSTLQVESNLSYTRSRSDVGQLWKLLNEERVITYLEKQELKVRSLSIPRITRTEGYPFWAHFYESTDLDLLTSNNSDDRSLNVEAVMSNCGYILVATLDEKLDSTFLPSGCTLKNLVQSTSDFQFSKDYIVGLTGELTQLETNR